MNIIEEVQAKKLDLINQRFGWGKYEAAAKAQRAERAQALLNDAITQAAAEVQSIVEANTTDTVKAGRLVKAVREDKVTGEGNSSIANCWTDEDIIDLLDEENITSMKAAVARFRRIEGVFADVAEDICQA